MEHFLVWLFLELFVRLDRASQKPLRREVPDLDRLFRDPVGYLSQQSVTIGPLVPAGSILLGSLLLTFLAYMASCFVFIELVTTQPRPVVPEWRTFVAVTGILYLLGVPVAAYFLMKRWFVGGRLQLHREGVELIYRQSTVFCPWNLFRHSGEVRHWKRNWAVLPVAPDAIAEVVAYRGMVPQSQGQWVRSRQLKFLSEDEMALRNLYRVDIKECAAVLVWLGSQLADP